MPHDTPAHPLLDRLAAHHADTWRHSLRVARFAGILAAAAGLDGRFGRGLALAAALHDIGKLAVPVCLLQKPAALTAAEQACFRRHPDAGARRLAVACDSPLAVLVARHHHERWDGSGYPLGLAGAAIPLAARLVSLADVYDAVRAPRAYKPGRPHREAMQMIGTMQSQFDPALLAAFRTCAAALDAAYREETSA